MTHAILNWKKCKECGKYFDIGTNKDKCPKCRKKEKYFGLGVNKLK